MNWKHLYLAGLCFTTRLQAEELTGTVYVTGSALRTATHIDVDHNGGGPRLCPCDLDNRIRRLGELQVQVVGTWQLLKDGVRDCFAPKSFRVIAMVSGRDAAVGKLSATAAGAYTLTAADGALLQLVDLPGHLREMMGEQVILDLKPMGNPAVKEVNRVVVSYRRYP